MKKGQVHISETILVLFVVIVIILLGMIVYFRFSIEKNKALADELSEEEATVLLAKVNNLGEFSCSDEECMDTSKFLPFRKALGEDIQFYRNVFGRKKITFKRIYPEPSDDVKDMECDVSKYIQLEYPNNCAVWSVYDYNPENALGPSISVPISLYFPEIDEYHIGRLEIQHFGDIRN